MDQAVDNHPGIGPQSIHEYLSAEALQVVEADDHFRESGDGRREQGLVAENSARPSG